MLTLTLKKGMLDLIELNAIKQPIKLLEAAETIEAEPSAKRQALTHKSRLAPKKHQINIIGLGLVL